MKATPDSTDAILFQQTYQLSRNRLDKKQDFLISYLLDLDEEQRRTVLDPMAIISINRKKKEALIDKKELYLNGFKPVVHMPVLLLSALPIDCIPTEIQRSALLAGAALLEKLLDIYIPQGIDEALANRFFHHLLKLDKWIFAESTSGPVKGTKTTCAWMTQQELLEANTILPSIEGKTADGQKYFICSQKITLKTGIRACFRYGESHSKVIRNVYSLKPTLRQVVQAIALARSGEILHILEKKTVLPTHNYTQSSEKVGSLVIGCKPTQQVFLHHRLTRTDLGLLLCHIRRGPRGQMSLPKISASSPKKPLAFDNAPKGYIRRFNWIGQRKTGKSLWRILNLTMQDAISWVNALRNT